MATVAYFILGWLWYGPIFGKLWARETGMSMEEKVPPAQMAQSMGLNLVGNVLLVYVFAHVLEAFTESAWTPGGAARTMSMAVQGAMFTWLGFFVPKELGGVAWEKRTWTVAGINAAYALVSLIMIAGILTAWP